MVRRPKWIRKDELLKTFEEVWDAQTLMAAYEVMRRLRLKRFAGVVSAGKEARVYRAVGRDGREYAVKIYLTMTAEFRKSIYKYLIGDPRFQSVDTSNTKKLFFAWARKEYRNLKRMYEAGAPVPRPYLVYQNIVVMEFLGENGVRSPLLHELEDSLEPGEALRLFREAVEAYKTILCCAGLVHADYSEFNLMLHRGRLYVIDVAQAVQLDHPNSPDFLAHDMVNITRFFGRRLGVETPTAEDLVAEVTSCDARACPVDKWVPSEADLEHVAARARDMIRLRYTD